MSDAVMIALIASVPGTIAGLAAFIASVRTRKAVEEVHKATNSLTDRLVETTRVEAHAAGVKEGELKK